MALLLAAHPDPTLLLWYRFDEASGTVAADSSGNGRNGTVAGQAAFVTGQLGNAIDLDGSDPKFVQLPDGLLTQLDDFTIATVPERSARLGDLHAGIDDAVFDISPLLDWAERDEAEGAAAPPEPEDDDAGRP